MLYSQTVSSKIPPVWLASILVISSLNGCALNAASNGIRVENTTPSISVSAIWDDPVRCHEMIKKGRRIPLSSKALRVGTWNIRWFPDGKPGNAPRVSQGTDLSWAACIIAYMQVDLLALQEIKLTERGVAALDSLQQELEQLTGGPWARQIDRCPTPSQQHLVFLYQKNRLRLSHVDSHSIIDPTAKLTSPHKGCRGRLRPALAAYVTTPKGLDFHFITGHLDSGRKNRDYQNRKSAWGLLEALQLERLNKVDDTDIVIAADFNMMGCTNCESPTSSAEKKLFTKTVGQLPHPLQVPQMNLHCTEYYRGKGYLLDQVVTSTKMDEARGAKMRVTGICAAKQCRQVPPHGIPAFTHLSDHCPVLIDLNNSDMD